MQALRHVRDETVKAALALEHAAGKRPEITGCIAELDVALWLGMGAEALKLDQLSRGTNNPGFDILHDGVRYQVKARRDMTSRAGSAHTMLKLRSDNFDVAVYVIYDPTFCIRALVKLTREETKALATPCGHVILSAGRLANMNQWPRS